MKVLSYFPANSYSNTYILGPEEGGSAILIDPGLFSTSLLELIENNNFYISVVLITHSHDNHVEGLTTLMKIYQAQVFAGCPEIKAHKATQIDHGSTGTLGDIRYDVIEVNSYLKESRVYKIGNFLFTGDSISAGQIGYAESQKEKENLIFSLKQRVLCFDANSILLPGHGPPSSIGSELKWNPDLK